MLLLLFGVAVVVVGVVSVVMVIIVVVGVVWVVVIVGVNAMFVDIVITVVATFDLNWYCRCLCC